MTSRDEVTSNIAHPFRKFILEIWKDLNFGLCRSKVEVETIRSIDGMIHPDHFMLVLPYAGEYLRWEVLFDAIHPWYAPDFRFDDERFLDDVNTEFIEKNLPSLANWNVDNPKALSSVITELMGLYRQHQKNLLNRDENSRVSFEYMTLVGQSSTSEDDIEILIGPNDNANFLIKLNIDCSQLPTLFPLDSVENPGGDCAIVLIKYPNPNRVELTMSPLVTQVVGDIVLPPIRDDAVLMDYIPAVTYMIDQKITAVIEYKRRIQEFLAEMIVTYENSVLEHGEETSSYLLKHRNFYCLLRIEIDLSLPKKPPTLTLDSVDHIKNSEPHSKILSDHAYDNFKLYLKEEIESFEQECVNYYDDL